MQHTQHNLSGTLLALMTKTVISAKDRIDTDIIYPTVKWRAD